MDGALVTCKERCWNALSALTTERALLDRMIYKYKNAHRRGVYFRKVLEVRRCLRRDDITVLWNCLSDIQTRSSSQTTAAADVLVRECIARVGPSLRQSLDVVVKCCVHLLALVKQTYFMAMSLTLTAVLSRIYCLHRYALNAVRDLAGTVAVEPWLSKQAGWMSDTAPCDVVRPADLSAAHAILAVPNTPDSFENDDSRAEPDADAMDVVSVYSGEDTRPNVAVSSSIACSSSQAEAEPDTGAARESKPAVETASSQARKPKTKKRKRAKTSDDVDDIFSSLL
ncbi:unnamed protein product (mitochondrion) [Plasmodiophora brassicae]|uniref:Uncharacterized protein n=1 Tax=Plasmodiophora brassicae TaxID=37360 RepID=A0A3P3YIX8_PLABS|nr:unnamed protein product [Plasmodiophora brassicae]